MVNIDERKLPAEKKKELRDKDKEFQLFLSDELAPVAYASSSEELLQAFNALLRRLKDRGIIK